MYNGTGAGQYAVAGRAGAPAPPVAGINARNQIISSGQAGTLYTPGELVQYPFGFEPQEAVKDTDYQYNLGVTANVADWNVDAAISYGKDINDIYTLNSRQPIAVHRHPHHAHQFL